MMYGAGAGDVGLWVGDGRADGRGRAADLVGDGACAVVRTERDALGEGEPGRLAEGAARWVAGAVSVGDAAGVAVGPAASVPGEPPPPPQAASTSGNGATSSHRRRMSEPPRMG
ncbi:MAG: hypothetical protein ACJ735_08090 [Actinomycetes bacterium]